MVVCAIFLWAYFGPGILRGDVYTADMSQWTSWAYFFRDNSLFANDPNREYFVAAFPLAYRILLEFAAPIVDPQLFGESLGLALGAVVAFLGYRLGLLLCDGREVGGLAALLLIMLGQFTRANYFNLLFSETGGIPRSFALAIVMLGVIVAYRRNWPAMGGCFLLAALFYPPALIMLVTYSVIVLANDLVRTRRLPPGFWPFVALAVVSIALLAGITKQALTKTGPVYTRSEMIHMPEFHHGGILQLFFSQWSDHILRVLNINPSSPGMSLLWAAIVFLTLMIGTLRKDPRVVNAAFWALPVSAIINYAVANAMLLRLYEPSRYATFPFLVLGLCSVVLGADYAVRWMGPKIFNVTASQGRRMIIIAVSLGLLVLAGTVSFTARMRLRAGGTSDYMPSAMYERLRTLPTDSVIASLPLDGNRIPMRSQRSALLMFSSMYPYHPNYYVAILRKFEFVMNALYDPTSLGVISLRDEYRIRYLLVDQSLAEIDPILKLQPFVKSLALWKARLNGRQPYVLSPPAGSIVFREGSYLLLDLNRIESADGL